MTQLTGQFPNETYINGLRDNPESTLAVVYDEFRLPIIQSIRTHDTPETTAAAVFQLAVFDAVRLARSGQLQANIPFFDFLKTLSNAHLKVLDTAEETTPETSTDPADALNAEPSSIELPNPEALLETQNKFEAWDRLQGLDDECRRLLLHPEASEVADAEADPTAQIAACREQFKNLLIVDPEPTSDLPAWAQTALADPAGYAIWQRTSTLEQDWAAGPVASPESNRTWRWAVSILILVALGYGIYQFYFRPKTAAEVFADNFAPPTSLMEDMHERYDAEMGNDSVTARPSECFLLLREADVYYQAKEYQSAIDPLLLIVLDSASICQSDAWYFMGIIQLQLEDPTTAIQCFAKIEDLGRYGEDLYWYQAMAFVQLAKENPLLRDKAQRAIERTLGNTRDPERRKQAEKMLENLSK